VSQIDVFPTILDIAGCDVEPIEFGRSLTPLLERKTDALRDAVFSEIHQRTMIRDKSFKMVVDSQGTVLKLYDMLDDPQEEVNLVGSPGTEDTVQRLKLRMLEWYLGTQQRQRRE
jgi:arylsulfatase A-like enzyme